MRGTIAHLRTDSGNPGGRKLKRVFSAGGCVEVAKRAHTWRTSRKCLTNAKMPPPRRMSVRGVITYLEHCPVLHACFV